jgi:hypothetical protein
VNCFALSNDEATEFLLQILRLLSRPCAIQQRETRHFAPRRAAAMSSYVNPTVQLCKSKPRAILNILNTLKMKVDARGRNNGNFANFGNLADVAKGKIVRSWHRSITARQPDHGS